LSVSGEVFTLFLVQEQRLSSLEQVLVTRQKEEKPLKLEEVKSLLAELVKDLTKLDAEGLAHGNVHPSNILIDQNN